MIDWAYYRGRPWDAWTTFIATINGHVDVLDFALFRGCPTDIANLFRNAAICGQLEILQFLHGECGADLDQSLTCAARHDYFEIVQWLRFVNCPWDSLTCSYAAVVAGS